MTEEATSQSFAHSDRCEAKLCAFIEALAETGIVTDAAKIAGFSREYAYEVRGKDEVFAMLWNDAIAQSSDVLLREARRRAVDGVRRKIFYKGAPVIDPETGSQYIEAEYSDGLLSKMLAAYMPEMFSDKKEVKHSGEVGVRLVRILRPPDAKPLDDAGFAPRQSLNGTNGTAH